MQKQIKYKNVLIARFSALGDVAMTIPVVYSACRCYPEMRFVMITQPVAASLFIGAPENLVVIGVDVKKKYHGVAGMLRLTQDLCREYHIDAFVDLHSVIRTFVIGAACRLRCIPVRHINKGRGEKSHLTRQNHKDLHQLCTSRDRYYDTFSRLGFDFGENFDSLFVEAVDEAVFADVTDPKKSGEKWVAIAPFAKHTGKIYPVEKMEQVVASLSQRTNMKIFLFGGGDSEKAVLADWESKYGNVVSMANKRHGFHKELSLLSCCDVMISMDSANMHLASLVKLPVVSVWGATHPYCGFTGWKQSPENIVQLDLPCRPCSVFGNKPCVSGGYACLNGITPEMILNKVERVLNKNA